MCFYNSLKPKSSDNNNHQLHENRSHSHPFPSGLMKKLSARGGHVGPNLGVVEATVALHYVFDAPTDRLVFDVSHQTYIHKMLTGRMDAFLNPDHYNDVTANMTFSKWATHLPQ